MDFSEYYSGNRLYGDDFSPAQIQRWFEEEEDAYFKLATSTNGKPQDNYPYTALNRVHGYERLIGLDFDLCIGLGVGSGADLGPIAPQVRRFHCIEPAKKWWRNELFGKPATFVAPEPDGRIALPDNSVDLVVAIAVLHHIPNVTAILTELHRVLKPGGRLMLREPIVTMGEWGQPRGGLTKNERGLPLGWLRNTMAALGFSTENEQLCMFPPFVVGMARAFGVNVAANTFLTRVDSLISTLTAFNLKYYRPSFVRKFAASCILGIYCKAA